VKPVIFSDLNNKHKQLAALKPYLLERTEPQDHEAIEEAHAVLNGVIVKLYQWKHI